MQVVVDSLLTNYQDQGSGKVVLLLHGWGDAAVGLSGLQKVLSAKYRVITPDLPGFGATQAPATVWGLDEYAQFVQKFLQKIRTGELYAIIGHSNGGAIAIRGNAAGLLPADRLVLMASAGVRGTYKGRVKALRLITKAGKALTAPLPRATKQQLRRKVYNTVGSDMLVAEHLQETFKKVVTDDVRADASQVLIPTLLLYGEQDTATPPAYGELYHQPISDSTLQIIGGAGHFVHTDKPEVVAGAIKEFLR